MDLQDFEAQLMYFDLETPAEVADLLRRASEHYRFEEPRFEDPSIEDPSVENPASVEHAEIDIDIENDTEGDAEGYLRRAYELAPNNLTVLVALYRYYYYQHRYQDALGIADRVMDVVAPMIGFPDHWDNIVFANLAGGVMKSFTLVRFYLLALKGAAYLKLRQGNIADGVRMLNKVIELDSSDRLGAKALLRAVGPAVVKGAVAGSNNR